MDNFTRLRDALMLFPSVVERPNRFGTKHAYFYRESEFAHFHSEEQLDIRLSKGEADEVAKEAIENPFSSSWVLFNIKSDEDAKRALFLLKKAYDKVAN